MEPAAWNTVIAASMGLLTLLVAWVSLRVKSNMGGLVTLEKRLRIVEAAEIKCLDDNRQLREQNLDQEIRIRELSNKLNRFLPPLYVTADSEGKIVDVEGDAEAMLGWRLGELIGKSIDVLVPAEHLARHHEGIKEAKKSGAVRDVLIVTQALHRTGSKVNIEIALSQKSLEPWLVTAQINYRSRL